jgi:transcriptional regulator with XRE-family HTH domain
MIGAKIRAARQARNWTQAELAEASGISLNYIKQLEGGHKPNPTHDTLQKLARAFNLTLDELVDYDDPEPFPAPTLREWGVVEAEIAQYAVAWPYWSHDQRVKFLGSLRAALGLQATVRDLTARAQAKKRALERGLQENEDTDGATPPLAPQVAM